MLGRVFVAAMVVFLAMVAVKQGWVLRRVGVVGSCSVYAGALDGAQWEVCRQGNLEGWPDLSGRGCTSQGFRGEAEYWRCSKPLEFSPVI